MSTEKIIKNQAKKSLSGNWVQILSALTVVGVLFLIYQYFFTVILCFTGNIDFESGNIKNIDLYLYAVIILFLLAVSPFLNGTFKVAANIVLYGKSEITDIFYFFKVRKYFRTIGLNLLIILLFSLSSQLLDIYNFISTAQRTDFFELWNSAYYGESMLFFLAFVVSIAVKLLVFFIFAYYPLCAYALDDSSSVGKYAFGFIPFSFRHLGASIKLFFSFIGWILLSFFVVPVFYTLPYYVVSAVSSTRWLIMLDRSRGKI